MAKRNALLLALLLSAGAGTASADPSLLGASGGLTVPTTDVMAEGSMALSVSSIWIDRNNDTRDNAVYSVGCAPLRDVEAGLSYVSYRTRRAKDTLFHCKWRVRAQEGLVPALAIGAVDVVGELTDEPSAYLVIGGVAWAPKDPFSGEPTNPLRLHLGIGTGIYGDSPFACADWTLNKRVRLLVEWQKNLALGTKTYQFNVGARANVAPGFALSAGAMDMQHFGLGLTYTASGLF